MNKTFHSSQVKSSINVLYYKLVPTAETLIVCVESHQPKHIYQKTEKPQRNALWKHKHWTKFTARFSIKHLTNAIKKQINAKSGTQIRMVRNNNNFERENGSD